MKYFQREDIERQLRLGEDSSWEFKQVKFSGDQPTNPSRNDWADEIAALANASGGVLLYGVTGAGEVQGMSREQLVELDNLLVEVSTDFIKPAVRIRTQHCELDGRPFLLLDVPESDSQHNSPGGSYLRVGGSKRQMASDERLRLAQRRGQARFPSFDERVVPGTGFNTLDEALWKPLLSAEGAANPEAALVKRALLAVDDAGITRATVAGVLLCTQDPEQWFPNACITATRYEGRDRASSQIDAKEFTGPLDRQIAAATEFVTDKMSVAARKTPARVNQPQYSDRALFEALVNAVVHRDYSMGSSRIRLSMFEDRLEIQSPGTLPNNLTIDGMDSRQATRNEALTSVLAYMPVRGAKGSQDRQYFMERRGDGVPIIRRETQELSGKLPSFELIDDSELRVIIPAAVQEQSEAEVVITTWADGRPLPDIELLVLFPNKTWKQATTNNEGEARVDLHTTYLPMKVFAAGPGYAAHVEQDWVPAQGALALTMRATADGGSVIFPEDTGQLPGLAGHLNPIRDTIDRTYLYASNIAVNQGKQQPVNFLLGEDLRLTDADGNEFRVRIVDITGRSALLEYRPWNPDGREV